MTAIAEYQTGNGRSTVERDDYHVKDGFVILHDSTRDGENSVALPVDRVVRIDFNAKNRTPTTH